MFVNSPKYLIYLHGFNSSPQSVKALQMNQFITDNCSEITIVTPTLEVTPRIALEQIITLVDEIKNIEENAVIRFVGSSMGGFLATLCGEKYDAKAVLINPAVAPHRMIESLIGDYTNPYSGEEFSVTMKDGDELAVMNFDVLLAPSNYWVLLQQGDETLDYHDALSAYQHSRITLEPLGDHGFVGFNRYLHAIVEFLFEN
tara:strand:+ start:695 stop:1297 length:603 start_codon:yes stop_codon:yes gene_type:complete